MPITPVQQVFDQAVRHHEAGRLHEAEALYRQVLSRQPRHADALNMLGVLAHQLGRTNDALQLVRSAIAINPEAFGCHGNLGLLLAGTGAWDEAISEFQKALTLRPGDAGICNNLGSALLEAGRLDEAMAAYQQALTARPDFPEAHYNVGKILHAHGNHEQAIPAYREALRLRPNYLDALNNLGNALYEMGHFQAAITAYRQALSLKPNFPQAMVNLGNALRRAGRLDDAITTYRQALELQPRDADICNTLADTLRESGRVEESLAPFRQVLALKPGHADAFNNLGSALLEQGCVDEAIAELRQALKIRPEYAEAFNNLGTALQEQGCWDEAMDAFRQACALKKDYPEPRWNLALALLLRGNFMEGWAAYEARFELKERSNIAMPTGPRWDGGDLAGRTILLTAEQGLGDTIQFVRYAHHVVAKGGRVVLQCQPPLRRLLDGQCGVEQVVSNDKSIPHCELSFPLLSLPGLLGTTLESIPATVPYLTADPALVANWRSRLAAQTGEIKVGLNWAGNAMPPINRKRSLPLRALAPLGDIGGVRFYSLQKGDAAAEAKSPPANLPLVDWTQDISDFADTAALIGGLDLIITCDTSVAHLAGALGKPTWVLLPFAPDWRWLLDRADSPWYPTMRLFRQPRRGDWQTLLEQVADALGALSCLR